ncbi:MAG: helix-turn-helix transcriptional regulator, partial [Clostridia bacterium]|nr:helix-turn-helix transcriptional regulator [Clostridia bacterium]
GFNQTSLAEATGIEHTNISDFLADIHMPSYDNFVRLLYAFRCSADYLLGETEIHTEEPLHEALPFHERLRFILKSHGISQEKLKRDLPVSSSVVYKWLKGISRPSMERLIALARYFGCSIDYLIGRTR